MRVPRAVGGALAALGLLAAAVAVSVAWQHPTTRPVAQACCSYSPARLARGEVWTVIGSALLLPRVAMIGPTTLMTAALLVPYAVAAGGRPALRAFFAGHVLATLVVAAIVLPAAALHWSPAIVVRAHTDVGASAGLAGAAGALCMLGRKRAGAIVLAALALWYGTSFAATGRLVEVEHLIALAAGAVTELRRRREIRTQLVPARFRSWAVISGVVRLAGTHRPRMEPRDERTKDLETWRRAAEER